MCKEFKKKLVEARGIKVDEKKNFYADSYQKNIYPGKMDEQHIRMFCKGGGKELFPKDGEKEKAAAIHSSSMLSYNFFHWIDEKHPLILYGVRYTNVVFEEQFRVLSSRNNKANMDVVLFGKNQKGEKTFLLFESKFTEHLNPKNIKVDIAEAYDDPEGYFAYGKEWVPVIKSLRDRMAKNEATYFEGLKQVACHLMGISSVIENTKARAWFNKNSWLNDQFGITMNGDDNFIFRSIVFHPMTKNEEEQSADYEKKNREFVSAIGFLPPNVDVTNPIMTYRDLWINGMAESLEGNPGLKAYLERYLAAHV